MKVERLRLENGLTVLAEEMHDAPVVALQAWVNVGSADEDESIAGIAHLHEHMLFKGTARRGVGEIARAVEAGGGEINAWTSFDQTVYHVVLSAAELGLGLDVLADALRRSSFDPGELEREIEVVVEEIRRAEDVPARRVSKALFELAFARHPYRRPVLGTEASVRGLSRERILAFYRRYYQPSQVTLVCTGAFALADLKAQVQHLFGDWQNNVPADKPVRPTELPHSGARVRLLREQVKEARLALAWPIPGLKHEDIAAIDALSVLLGHGESSRLYIETRRRQELVNDVYAYSYTPRDPGLLMVGAGLRQENLVGAAESLLDEVYRLREHLVPQSELAKAKVIIKSDSAYQRETVQGEARRLGFFEVVAGDWRFEERYRQSLDALTPEHLREVARRYLDDKPASVVQLPEDEAQAGPNEQDLVALVQQRFRRAESLSRTVGKAVGAGEVQRVVLDNGAVLLVRATDAPVVAVRAALLGGLRWETPATAGLGHLFASVWGMATFEMGPEALAREVALLGGSLTAFSGRNTLGMRGEFIAERGLDGLALFCQALLQPRIEEGELLRERAVILERIKSREDNPAGVAFELFAELLHPKHSYGLRLAGTEETVERFTVEDVLAYRRTFATPDKLVVAVVGGIDAERVVDLLSRELEEGKGGSLPPCAPPDSPPSQPRFGHYRLDRKQTHVIVGSLGTTLFDHDRYALEVLTTVMSGQSGRLFLDLRDRQSLAYSVSSSSLEGLDPGHVLFHMGTSPEKLDQALAGLDDHLCRIREEQVSAEELERAQRYLVGTHAIDLQRSGARAMQNALGERFGLGYDSYTRYPERIWAVDRERVQQAAQRYLAPERLITVTVGPGEAALGPKGS